MKRVHHILMIIKKSNMITVKNFLMKIDNIVIIGSSGFVGSNLIKKIKNHHLKKINSKI